MLDAIEAEQQVVHFDEWADEDQVSQTVDKLEAKARWTKRLRIIAIVLGLSLLGLLLVQTWRHRDKLAFFKSRPARTDTVDRTNSELRAEIDQLKRRLNEVEKLATHPPAPPTVAKAQSLPEPKPVPITHKLPKAKPAVKQEPVILATVPPPEDPERRNVNPSLPTRDRISVDISPEMREVIRKRWAARLESTPR
ncbi:MAG TPA: hypothetical protein VF974_08585 [Patescibacteria group bacterium]